MIIKPLNLSGFFFNLHIIMAYFYVLVKTDMFDMKLMKSYEEQLSLEVEQRRMTVELIKLISDLWYENNIELFLFRNQLIDRNVSEILNLLDYAKEFVQKPISISNMLKIAQKIREMDLPPAKIDIGKLAYVFHLTGETKVG